MSTDQFDLRQRLGRLLAHDLDLSRRFDTSQGVRSDDIDELVALAAAAMKTFPLVYTAFDGDHQQLSPLMRRAVLHNGGVPVNPDSVLDYKETASARQTKKGVLMDDLSILRSCDQIYVFSDASPDASGLNVLAEGVLVELLFFLKRRPSSNVFFCSSTELLIEHAARPSKFDLSYHDVKAALPHEVLEGVLSLTGPGIRTDAQLPNPVYYITDPLDFKYARFILPRVYQRASPKERFVPLIPPLAVQTADVPSGLPGLGDVVLSWLRLAEVASSAAILPSMDRNKRPSQVAELLKRNWFRQTRPGPLQEEDWRAYSVPKANQGRLWPITAKERQSVCEDH